MNYLHTYVQLKSNEDPVFTADDIILPTIIGDKIQINQLWYEVIDITYHCDSETYCKFISKTIWVKLNEE